MDQLLESHAVRILALLYLFEIALAVELLGIRQGATVFDATHLATSAGAMLMAGTVALAVSAALLARQLVAAGPRRARAAALGLTTGLVSTSLALLIAEAGLHLAARSTPDGLAVRSVSLRPTWPELTARSRQVLGAAAPWGSWDAAYFVYDGELGWTVGPNRHSPNGLYHSSVEGLRSAGPDEHLADGPLRPRVALVGDSQAFSYEVPFDQSWGFHLQRLLGEGVQVLNFGVDGYGIDQMYLRYQRDVRPWKPQVVIVGFSGHDLRRTMAVYPFVSFNWPGYVVKPRFTLEGQELKLLNVPLPTPDQVLGASGVRELPFVGYDLGYATTGLSWRFDHGPLLLRFLASAFPRRDDPRVALEPTKELNSRLFTELVRSIEREGAVPLVVLMFSRNELVPDTLARAHLSYLDMTQCVASVPADERTVPSGHHYTGRGNEAIARCTAPAVEQALARPLSSHVGPAQP